MTFSRHCVVFILLSAVCFLTACEAAPVASSTTTYQKPGARVALQDASELRIDTLGEHSMLIPLSSRHNEGVMTIRVSASDGLLLLSDNHYRFDKAIDLDYQIPVRLRADRHGRFYLYFHVEVYDGGKSYSRQLGVAVQVGELDAAVQKPTDKSDVKLMPATEEVRSALTP